MSSIDSEATDPRAWLQVVKPLVGQIVDATVIRVDPNFAVLHAPKLPISNRAFMHVSQFSSAYTESLIGLLTPGQEVSVLVIKYDREREEWVVQTRNVEAARQLQSEFITEKPLPAIITSIGPTGTRVDVNGISGRIGKTETEFLSSIDVLQIGSTRLIQVIRPDPAYEGVLVTSGAVPSLKGDEIVSANLVLVQYDHRIGNRKTRWHILITALSPQGTVIQSKLTRWVDPLSRLKVGATFQFKIIRKSEDRSHYWADVIGPFETLAPYREQPKIGQTMEATVDTVENYAAFCSVQDGRSDMLHRSQIVKDSVAELRAYVASGDILEVKVRAPIGQERDYGLDFVRLLRRLPDASAIESSGPTFDLTAARRVGSMGGYSRKSSFRADVLERFRHTCAVCALNCQLAPTVTAAEAAHIIPRGNRGVDAVENGVCLCRVHHWSFDNGLIGIRDDRTVIVCPAILESTDGLGKALAELDGKLVYWPDTLPLPLEGFRWHRRNIFLSTNSLADA